MNFTDFGFIGYKSGHPNSWYSSVKASESFNHTASIQKLSSLEERLSINCSALNIRH